MKSRHRNTILGFLMLTMLLVNGIASSSEILGFALKNLYQIFPFSFMPPAWAFMISRGLIYLLGIGFFITYCIYQRGEKSHHWNQDFFPYYLSILLLNIAWIFATTQKLWIVSGVIIAAMFINLYLILKKISTQNKILKQLGNAARGIYMGWINVATIVLGLSQVIYSLGYTHISSSPAWLITVSIGAAFVTGISFYQLRNWYMLGRSIFALWAVWIAFLGQL